MLTICWRVFGTVRKIKARKSRRIQPWCEKRTNRGEILHTRPAGSDAKESKYPSARTDHLFYWSTPPSAEPISKHCIKPASSVIAIQMTGNRSQSATFLLNGSTSSHRFAFVPFYVDSRSPERTRFILVVTSCWQGLPLSLTGKSSLSEAKKGTVVDMAPFGIHGASTDDSGCSGVPAKRLWLQFTGGMRLVEETTA